MTVRPAWDPLARARRLLVALSSAAACHAAQAERSHLADDADVVEAGDCQMEATSARQTARTAAAEHESSIQFDCGVGWRTELAAAFVRLRSEGVRDEAIGIEARTSLRQRGSGRIGWTLAYGIGAERGGGPWRRSEQFVAIETSYQPDRSWLIEGRLGTVRDLIGGRDATIWALSAERLVTAFVGMRAELDGDDRGRPRASVELRYLVWPEHTVFTLSYGARAGPLRERRLGVGLTFEF